MDLIPEFQNLEFQILVEAARDQTKGESNRLITALISNDLDWEYLLQLAGYHGMLPLLYLALKNFDTGSIPIEIQESLKSHYFENTQQNIFLLGKLLKIIQLLRENGITAIPFKGPILSKALYDSYTIRQAGDLDIMVKPEHVVSVIRLLAEQGFHLHYPLSRNQQMALVKISRENRFNLQSHDSELVIEMHWRFYTSDFFANRDTEFIWKQVENSVINNVVVSNFKPEVMVLFLCFHGFKHNWFRLFWIWELAELINKTDDLDWDWIIEHAEKFGGQKVLLIGLYVVQSIFGMSLPGSIEAIISKDQESVRLAKQIKIEPDPGKLEVLNDFDLLDLQTRFLVKNNLISRAKQYLLFAITPNYYDIQPIDLPPALHFLYYIIRPLRLVSKYFQQILRK